MRRGRLQDSDPPEVVPGESGEELIEEESKNSQVRLDLLLHSPRCAQDTLIPGEKLLPTIAENKMHPCIERTRTLLRGRIYHSGSQRSVFLQIVGLHAFFQ